VKLNTRLTSLFIQALSQALPVDMMTVVVRRVVPDYDVYERSGFPSSIPMPRADAARHILKDFYKEGLFFRLVEALIDVHSNGVMGREVPISLLPRIVAEIEDQGYRYAADKGVFVEKAERGKTMGWGTLREGRTYEFALLRLDIAGNSALVRRYSPDLVRATFGAMKEIATRQVEKRDGRIWSWEGDGGLAAFYFGDKTIQATLCGIEILHELYLFNLLASRMPEPVNVRLAVHAGPCRFTAAPRDTAGETIRKVELLESMYTAPDSLTVSAGVYTDLGGKLSSSFSPVGGASASSLFRYRLSWDRQ
jgi:class 3 adenylate cyclase